MLPGEVMSGLGRGALSEGLALAHAVAATSTTGFEEKNV